MIKLFGSLRLLSLVDIIKISINPETNRGKCFSPPTWALSLTSDRETEGFFCSHYHFIQCCDLFSNLNYAISCPLHKIVLRLQPLHPQFYHPSFLIFSYVSYHLTTKNITLKKQRFSGKLGILTTGILRKIPNIRKHDKNHESWQCCHLAFET